MIPCRRDRDERGQAALEWVGVTLIVASLVGALLLVLPTANIRESFRYAICRILGTSGGCTAPGAARTSAERVPREPCVTGSMQGSVEATGSFVVTLKSGQAMLIESLSDGSYRASTIDRAGIGAGVGEGVDVSITIDGHKYGVTAIAGADAMLVSEKGKTWYADDRDDMKNLLLGIAADKTIDSAAPETDIPFTDWAIPNPVNWTAHKVAGLFVDDPGSPDEEWVEGGLEGSADAALSGIVGGTGADGQVGGYLGAKKSPDGYTAYFRSTLSAKAWAAAAGSDVTGKAGGEILTEVNFDEKGKSSSIKLTAGYTLDADAQGEVTLRDDFAYTERSYEIPLSGDTSHDAPLLAAALGSQSSLTGYPAMMTLINAAKEDGYVSQNVYAENPNEFGLNFTAEELAKFGGSLRADVTQRTLEKAQYWNGVEMFTNPNCSGR